jgi:hypothetical protein
MDKPNTIESVLPLSGEYSCKKDIRLSAWLLVATVTYIAVLLLTKYHPGWSPLTRGLLMLTPMIPGALYVRSWLRFISGMDEMQRRMQLEAWLFAALATLVISTAINILNASGVTLFAVLDHGLGLGGTFLLALVLWVVGTAIARARYK